MANGIFVVDVCKQADPDKLKQLVAASKAYWTSGAKGFKLISDDLGADHLLCFESAIVENVYREGNPKNPASGDVILIYQR